MKTIYRSEDGHHFDSRRSCKLYEEALKEIEKIDHLQYEVISGIKFFKINSEAELYFFDHLNDTEEYQSDKTLYDIFQDLKKLSFRFPIWIKEDGSGTKKTLIEKYEKEIKVLEGKINSIKENIKSLNKLDSRTKTPVVEQEDSKSNKDSESIQNEELEIEEHEV